MKKECKHLTFQAKIGVNRLTGDGKDKTPIGYVADIEIYCQDCKVKMEFIGLSVGVSNVKPTISASGTELRCPLQPSNEKNIVN